MEKQILSVFWEGKDEARPVLTFLEILHVRTHIVYKCSVVSYSKVR